MAFYKQDIVDIDLNSGNIFRTFLNHSIGFKNDDADRFGIRCFRDGEPVDLTGASCQAVFMRPDGSNLALTSYGTVSGNVAYVTLPQACYDYEGQFCLSIQLVGGGVTGTMRIVDGMVVNTGASGAVAPTAAVPTYQEVLAVYSDMVETLADYDETVEEQDNKITELKGALNNDIQDVSTLIPLASTYPGHFINTSGDTVVISYVVSGSGSNCYYYECLPGDVFYLKGEGGKSSRLWCFIDSNLNVLQKEFENITYNALQKIVAPANSAHIIVHTKGLNDLYKVDSKVKQEEELRIIPYNNYVLSFDANNDAMILFSSSPSNFVNIEGINPEYIYKITIHSESNRFRCVGFNKAPTITETKSVETYFTENNTDDSENFTYYLTVGEGIQVVCCHFGSNNDTAATFKIEKMMPKKMAESFYKTIANDGKLFAVPSIPGEMYAAGTLGSGNSIEVWGKNNIDENGWEMGAINDQGEETSSTVACRSEEYIPVLSGQKYCYSITSNADFLRICLYDKDKTFIKRVSSNVGDTKLTITIPGDTKYVRLMFTLNNGSPITYAKLFKAQFELGEIRTEYKTYQKATFTKAGTVYTFDELSYILCSDTNVTKFRVLSAFDKVYRSTNDYSEDECRTRFRLEMQERATRLNMNDTDVGDGGGWPVPSNITTMDAVRLLVQALNYQEIINTFGYRTGKIIRMRGEGVSDEVFLNNTVFNNIYSNGLSGYNLLGGKGGTNEDEHIYNLVCACSSATLKGDILVGCLSTSNNNATYNRFKSMKILMDLGVARVADRSADVSEYVSQLIESGVTHFSVCLLPHNGYGALMNHNFSNAYSLLYNYDNVQFWSMSMIKLLCAVTALDFIDDLDEDVTIVQSDLLTGTGASHPIFQAGQIVTYRDLIGALLIQSVNQASYVLERTLGKKMLQKYGAEGFLPSK